MSGTETIQEIELVDGRVNPGQSWIVKFNNIDSDEEVCSESSYLFIDEEGQDTRIMTINLWSLFCQARKLVGSAILVRDDDRPPLEEGEFYTHDLIGMRVTLKVCGLTISLC